MKLPNNELHAAKEYVRELVFPDGVLNEYWHEYWHIGYKQNIKKTPSFKTYDHGSINYWVYSRDVLKVRLPLADLYMKIETANPTTATVERLHSLYTALATKTKNRIHDKTLIMLGHIKFNMLYGNQLNDDWKSLKKFDPKDEAKMRFIKEFAEANFDWEEEVVPITAHEE